MTPIQTIRLSLLFMRSTLHRNGGKWHLGDKAQCKSPVCVEAREALAKLALVEKVVVAATDFHRGVGGIRALHEAVEALSAGESGDAARCREVGNG